jgi:hypothetical protein
VDLEFEARAGPCSQPLAAQQPLAAHRLDLTVPRLDALAVFPQGQLVGPEVWAHVGLADRHQSDAGVGQKRRLVAARVVRLVRVDGGTFGEAVGQLVDRRQVVQAPRQ